jgi:two-component system, sporulation sensor kinase E
VKSLNNLKHTSTMSFKTAARSKTGTWNSMDKIPEGCCIIGYDHRYLYVNAAAARQFCQTKDKLIGHDLEESNLFFGNREILAKIKNCLDRRIPCQAKNKIRLANKEAVWFELSILPVAEGICVLSRNISEVKQAKELLQARKINFSSFANAMESGLVILDMDLGIIFANKVWKDTFGRLTAGKCYQAKDPDNGICDDCPARKTLVDGVAHTSCREIVLPTGEVTYWETIANPIRNVEGEIISCIEIASDITRRRISEQNLRRAAEEWRKTFDSINDWVYILDKESRIVRANKAFAGYFHQNPKEVLGKTCGELIGDARNPLRDYLQKTGTSSGKPSRREYFDSQEMRYFEENTSLVYDEKDQVTSSIHVSRDITERKQAESLLQILADNSPIGVYVAQEGKFQYINHKAEEYLGFTRDDLTGKEFLEFIFPDDRKVVRKNVSSMLESKSHQPYEYRLLHRSGKPMWVLETVTSIQYQGSRAILGNFMDVSELKKLEKKIVEYEELDRLKTNLLSVVSHELRTPLTIIKGYSEMLIAYSARLRKPERDQYLKAIDESTNRLTRQVDQLLDISRMDAGLLKLQKTEVDLVELISMGAAELQHKMPGHRMITEADAALPKLFVDATRIRQVMDNLIENACKYSEEGTEIKISARKEGNSVRVSVADHGVGIAESDFDKLFDRMHRIENRLTSSTKGLGLGLYICKGLVEAHGGRIWAESRLGEGSTFTFSLPEPEVFIGNKN